MTKRRLPQFTDHHGHHVAIMPGLAVALLLLVVLSGIAWHFGNAIETEMNTPFDLRQAITYEVRPGVGLKQVAEELHAMGLIRRPRLFVAYGMMNGATRSIKRGKYEILPSDNPKRLLHRVLQGDVAIYKVTFPEGIRFSEAVKILRGHEQISVARNAAGEEYGDAEIMAWLGHDGEEPEGWFYPDTYNFPSGTSDLQILRLASDKMREVLAEAWDGKHGELVYEAPYEVLIMASIIQSEGLYPDEFHDISGVFHRRLERGIPLYSDPTVAYAHGEDFKPPLLRRHMDIDSPYNTYRVGGLPPTPISLPSSAAIAAALEPAPGDSLYFVALGNGRHHFSSSLEEHNRKRQEIKRAKREREEQQ